MERGSSPDICRESDKNQSDHCLRQLNRYSHKISKQLPRRHLIHSHFSPDSNRNHSPPNTEALQSLQAQSPAALPQPPVYNINKDDFRDVVQKLTGSPSTLVPIQPPKPQSSRLQRIRPPPLPNLTAVPCSSSSLPPYSPLPPFPSVSSTADSPVSAYLRFIRTYDTEQKKAISPQRSSTFSNSNSVYNAQYWGSSSPISFDHIPSPRLPYPLQSTNIQISTSSRELQVPPITPCSPRLPILGPKWR